MFLLTITSTNVVDGRCSGELLDRKTFSREVFFTMPTFGFGVFVRIAWLLSE